MFVIRLLEDLPLKYMNCSKPSENTCLSNQVKWRGSRVVVELGALKSDMSEFEVSLSVTV